MKQKPGPVHIVQETVMRDASRSSATRRASGMHGMGRSRTIVRGMPLGRVVLFSLVALSHVSGAGAPSGPMEAVKSATEKVLGILKDETFTSDERMTRIEDAVRGLVSYQEMAKRSLGTPWKELTEEQRQEFVDLFSQLIRNSTAARLDEYTDQKIEYLDERIVDGYAEVRTKLRGRKTNVGVNYRLLNKNGAWLVYDVVVDGVSTIKNYRSQFNEILQSSSYGALVQKLEHNIARAAPLKDKKD